MAKIWLLFLQKHSTETSVWVLNMTLGNTVKKNWTFKRQSPSHIKLFISLFLSCIYFVAKIRKNMSQKKVKDLYNL